MVTLALHPLAAPGAKLPMTGRNSLPGEPASSAPPQASGPGPGKGWKFIAMCIGFAITVLLTVAVALYVFLNTKAFE